MPNSDDPRDGDAFQRAERAARRAATLTGGSGLHGLPSAPRSPLPQPPTAPHAAFGESDDDDDDEVTIAREMTSPPATAAPLPVPVPAAGVPASAPVTPAPRTLPAGRGARAAAVPPAAEAPPLRSPSTPPRKLSPNALLKMALIGVAALLTVMLAAALTVLLTPQDGDLLVKVTGPGGESIDGLSVFVDDERRCTKMPCKVSGLGPGAHGVKAEGHGYGRTAERQIVVEAGREASLGLVLPPDPGTGIRINAKVSDLRAWVDDKEVGSVPGEVGGLAPGEHTLRVAGNPAFAPYEQKILVPAGQMVDVTVAPPVAQGTLRVERGVDAAGARVFLQVGSERRRLVSLPTTLEVQPKPDMMLIATKPGYQEFSRPIEFSPGEPTLVLTVDLTKEVAEEPEPSTKAATAAAPRRRVSAWKPPSKPRAAPVEEDPETAALNADPYARAAPSQPAPAGGSATVSVNSIPPSRVTLNGRDIGSTPQMGIEVAAGSVTAVFTHPEYGTLTRSGVVKPGGKLTLFVKFKQPE